MDQLVLPAELLVAEPATRTRIVARASVAVIRGQGHGLNETARRLTAAGVPTPSGVGRRWYAATVDRVERPGYYAAYQRAYRRRA